MNYDDHGIAELLAQKQAPAGTRMEVLITHWPRWRFTIANTMILVAIVAIMLAVPTAACVIAIALFIPCLSTVGARWLVFRRHRRLAALSFWVAALVLRYPESFPRPTPPAPLAD
jgi:hypothetical protein